MATKVEVSDDLQKCISATVTSLEKDDQFIREKNIKGWKKAEEYWRLNQLIYWSEVALDYKNINDYDNGGNDDDNQEASPKIFGIYRAYGESLIAAMAAVIPSVFFFPDDADNPDDITTSKAYSLISELIQKHNKAPILFIRALTTLYNQGLVASYTYWDEDESYGMRNVPKFKNEKVELTEANCPKCQHHFGNLQTSDNSSTDDDDDDNTDKTTEVDEKPDSQASSEITPEEQQDVKAEKPFEKEYTCPECGYKGQAEAGRAFEEIIPRLVGYTDNPKGRVVIDTYGPLNVRINSYAKRQSDIGLLELQLEMHSAAAKDEFEEIADEISATSDFYSYERWGRTSNELLSDTMFNQVTVRYCWIRNWGFEILGKTDSDKKNIKELKKKFPHGCCVIFVNDIFARAYDEALDDHWTISENPLDSWLHGLPMGKTILDVQDAINELKNLNIQKEEFGISETFVGTDILDETSYREQQAGPGYVTFVDSRPGEPISNSMMQTKTANLDEYDLKIVDDLNSDAQFLLGAFPSIFGGNQTTGSKTASEYNQSRNYALQRLSNHWTNIKYWWAATMSKACRLFATKMLEDEKFVKRNGNNFETVWIKQAELKGKIGNVEPDVDEQFPTSWSQKKDLLMQLITMQNPVVGEILLHPNNAGNVKSALGFPEFYMPGEADRTKQLIEIRKLINITAEQLPPNSTEPTVPIDTTADDDNAHIQVGKLWMVSEVGMYVMETNPAGYLNVTLHIKMHEANAASKMQGQVGDSKPGEAAPTAKPNPVS